MLKAVGNDTRAVYDGREAIDVCREFTPHVVLLDIGLPLMNGYEVCRQLRTRADGKQMMIVAQTGWGAKEDREKSKQAGFDAHMVKPVDPHALMELLAGLDRVKV